MRQRKVRIIVFAITFVFLVSFSIPAYASSSVRATFADHMAGTSGDMAYYAVGIDGGGPLYSYNVKTKEKTLLASGHWTSINQKGKYLYAAQNKYEGSDARNQFVYKISKDGKTKKKLANGYCPVVKGKYIYYFAVSKKKWYGGKADGKVKGIYRMKLNGKGKKKLVGFSNKIPESCAEHLGVINKKRFIFDSYEFKWYSAKKGTKGSKRYKGKVYTNMTVGMCSYQDFKSITKVKVGKTIYTASGNKLFAKNSEGKKTVAKVSGNIEKIIVSGKQILLITEASNSKYYVYIMEKNGQNVNRVAHGVNVSGGWGN